MGCHLRAESVAGEISLGLRAWPKTWSDFVLGEARFGRIETISKDILRAEEGSLYPALHKMELEGWIESEWGVTENNRRAKYYRLTALGRRQLKFETELREPFS